MGPLDLASLTFNVDPGIDKIVERVLTLLPDTRVEGRPARVALGVDVRPVGDQKLDHEKGAVFTGSHQHCPPYAMAGITINEK